MSTNYNQSATTYNYNQQDDLIVNEPSVYTYNNLGEVIVPVRTNTTRYGPRNYKHLTVYTGLDTDIEFYLRDKNGRFVNIQGKTFTATVVERDTNNIRLTTTLIREDQDTSKLIMRVSRGDSSQLTKGLYELYITYTDWNANIFALYSDENNKLRYVFEVKNNPLPTIRASEEVTSFSAVNVNGVNRYYSSRLSGTAPTYNQDGTNTIAVYTGNFTGALYAEGSLDLQPSERDWFSIQLDPESANDQWDFTSDTNVTPFTWDGMFVWVRFYYIPSVTNTGTLDKILYRN